MAKGIYDRSLETVDKMAAWGIDRATRGIRMIVQRLPQAEESEPRKTGERSENKVSHPRRAEARRRQ